MFDVLPSGPHQSRVIKVLVVQGGVIIFGPGPHLAPRRWTHCEGPGGRSVRRLHVVLHELVLRAGAQHHLLVGQSLRVVLPAVVAVGRNMRMRRKMPPPAERGPIHGPPLVSRAAAGPPCTDATVTKALLGSLRQPGQ